MKIISFDSEPRGPWKLISFGNQTRHISRRSGHHENITHLQQIH